jgi:hypothetical protein
MYMLLLLVPERRTYKLPATTSKILFKDNPDMSFEVVSINELMVKIVILPAVPNVALSKI